MTHDQIDMPNPQPDGAEPLTKAEATELGHPLPSDDELAQYRDVQARLAAWYEEQLRLGASPELPDGFTPEIMSVIVAIRMPSLTHERTLDELLAARAGREVHRFSLRGQLADLTDPVATGTLARLVHVDEPGSLYISHVDETRRVHHQSWMGITKPGARERAERVSQSYRVFGWDEQVLETSGAQLTVAHAIRYNTLGVAQKTPDVYECDVRDMNDEDDHAQVSFSFDSAGNVSRMRIAWNTGYMDTLTSHARVTGNQSLLNLITNMTQRLNPLQGAKLEGNSFITDDDITYLDLDIADLQMTIGRTVHGMDHGRYGAGGDAGYEKDYGEHQLTSEITYAHHIRQGVGTFELQQSPAAQGFEYTTLDENSYLNLVRGLITFCPGDDFKVIFKPNMQ